MAQRHPLSPRAAFVSLAFAQLGHSYTHVLVLLYPTVVLALEPVFGLSYGELIVLMTGGSFLYGLGALPAGWLGDRWSTLGMMVVFFVGMGAATILTGLASTPLGIAVGLGLIGLFASIYHPVGMAWLVRNAENRGRALGINGVFGAVGMASAALIAGWLTDLVSWRAAFIVPGAICLATGLTLWVLVGNGYLRDSARDVKPGPAPSRESMVRAFFVLSVTMVCAGLLFQSFSIAMPKVFAERLGTFTGGTVAGAGTLVSVIYACGVLAQLVGGHLADRYPLQSVYRLLYLAQVPALLLVAAFSGLPLFFSVAAAMMLGTIAVPVENSLLSHYSPEKWRGTAFGAKFMLSIGVGTLSVPLVAVIHEMTGDFFWLFVLLAGAALVLVIATLALPREGARATAAQAGAGNTGGGSAPQKV
ncbi:MAG: MFS transporter [Betaproteobacteria bacterium]|nr:MFS transporter [Betaproteobacteria bacterium]